MASNIKVTIGDAVLADDAASPPTKGFKVDQLGGECMVQTEALYGGANEFKAPLGNVGGQFVFTAGVSYASLGDSADAIADFFALLNTQDDCVFIYGAATLTMANAILRKVERTEWEGKWLSVRFTLEITTIVSS